MKAIRRVVLSVFGVFLLAAVVACGGGSSSNSNNGSSGGGNNNGSSGGSSSGNADLRLISSDPLTLDPALAQDEGSAQYIVEIFSGLVTLDPNLKVVPDIAESWDLSQDGKTYTFHIRKNAAFHDGRPVTADDFKYSIDRAATLGQSTSITAENYLGDIVGVNDVIAKKATSVSGVKVIDPQTVSVTIDAPKAYFLAKLTYPTAFVVDKNQTGAVTNTDEKWSNKPNGTGPYKLVEWRVNERILLQANEKFYLGAPSVQRVMYNLAGGSSLTQYENNETDVSGISINDIERVQSASDPLHKDYVKAPELSVSYIGFNTTQKPFDDPKVRLAFSQAIDKTQVTHVIFKDMLGPASSIMMPGLPGYSDKNQAPKFDPAAAKQDLADSKYKNAQGLGSITLTEQGSGGSSGLDTQAIVEMLKTNLGVDVTIAESEQATFYDDLDKGKLQMWTNGWIMDYPDPEDILDLLFRSNSRQNDVRYNNPQVDSLLNAARTEQDVNKRLGEYQQAEAQILADEPWIPLYFGEQHYVVKPYVQNYKPGAIVVEFLRNVKVTPH